MSTLANPPAGLYIHIPFCVKKCPYCDFYSITDRSLLPVLIDALVNEIKLVAKRYHLSFDTLYLGGGTPSILDIRQLETLIDAVYRYFRFMPDREVTLEVNPGTVSPAKLKAYRSMGIDRVSIGIQTLRPDALEWLGRIHTRKDGIDAILSAREAGFENLSVDMIYGIPGQTQSSWEHELKEVIAFSPEHFSCYMLSYEKGTPLTLACEKKRIIPLSETVVGDMFEQTSLILHANRYDHYEISNFAASTGIDRRSRHNSKYWTFVPYLGLGPSAHSMYAGVRWWNARSVRRYCDMVFKGNLPICESENLTTAQRIIEALFLGLRTKEGIDIPEFDMCFGGDFRNTFSCLERLADDGFIRRDLDRCALTLKGMRFMDSIVAMLMAHSDKYGGPKSR